MDIKSNYVLALEKLEKFCASNDIRMDEPRAVTSHSRRLVFHHVSGESCSMIVDTLKIEIQGNYDDFVFNVIKHLRQNFNLAPYNTANKVSKSDALLWHRDSELWTDIKCRINSDSVIFARDIEVDSVTIYRPDIIDVKFNGPATIVFWDDGVKTIVRCNDEDFDKEKGLAMAIAKRFLGTNKSHSNYCDIFKKFILEVEKTDEVKTKKSKLYSVKVYSRLIGKSESTVRKMCREGKLNAFRPNGENWLIRVED